MALKDVIAAKGMAIVNTYSAPFGILGGTDSPMPKAGEFFIPQNDRDIELLEEFVANGLITKVTEAPPAE